MNFENTIYLIEKYPKLYVGHTRPISENLMSFGFECGDGWFKIIDKLSAKIEEYNNTLADGDEHCIAIQVKEKFGSLRFYTMFTPEEIDKLIVEAEILSEKTCEECGEPSEIFEDYGWFRSLCEKCRLRKDGENEPDENV